MTPLTVPRPGRRSRPGRMTSCLAVLTLLFTPLLPAGVVAQAAPSEPPSPSGVNVEQTVLDEFAQSGTTDFWVVFEDDADLSAAVTIGDWAERGQYVYDQLTGTARASQAELIAVLTAQGVAYEPFWITNAVLVRGGDLATLSAARSQSGVAEIRAANVVELPDPIDDEDADDGEARINAVEWGIANIRADQAWSQFGARGQGVVVGSIDTGVEYTHPALVEQYRGNVGGGAFDHDYTWWDPSGVCPSDQPCDNNGHGTHTTGTMVGDDGADNQIGVAPSATWIAAKGCESSSCSDAAVVSAGQFMLAPTDLAGDNPRPELRPHVVNNSWGDGNGGAVNPLFRDIVTAWTASGIFGVFSNGNEGPSCDTTGSPADLLESWGVGAYDQANTIASFSSHGPGENGQIRPSISAPGVDVRSAFPGGLYATASGTSMAAPHQSGAVALMWSVGSTLVGDVTETRRILAETAIDTEDLTCGGLPEHNNVYGDGRLDAFTAVDLSPRGPQGSLAGTVLDTTGDPIAGATISLEVEDRPRSVRTAADGTFTFASLPVESYHVTARAFWYVAQTSPAVVVEGATTTLDFALDLAPTHPLSGTVTDDRGASLLAGATVTLDGTPLVTTTDADGHYVFSAVPEGSYTIRFVGDGCLATATSELVVDGPETLDVALAQRTDSHGYTCRLEPAQYIEATETADPYPADFGHSFWVVDVPFPFPFYDSSYTTAYIGSTGYLNFRSGHALRGNHPIPDEGFEPPFPVSINVPNAAIYPFWTEFGVPDEQTRVLTATIGDEGSRKFVVEWRNMYAEGDPTRRWDFEVILDERGGITFAYRNISPDSHVARGGSATVGIENATGTDALQYSFDRPSLSDSYAIRITPPGGLLSGTINDANDHQTRSRVQVSVAGDGETTRTAMTSDDGSYALQVPLGTSTVTFSRGHYRTETREITVDAAGGIVTLDISLRTAAATLDATEIEVVQPTGRQQTYELRLTNTGSLNLDWQTPVVPRPESAAAPPDAANPGDILGSWRVHEPPRGVGYADGRIWLTTWRDRPPESTLNWFTEYSRGGTPTGRAYAPAWAQPFGELFPSGMVFDLRRGWMCALTGSYLNKIVCWDPNTGAVMDTMHGSPGPHRGYWSDSNSIVALAHNPDDDTFYVYSAAVIYHVAGFSHRNPGETLGQCSPDLSPLALGPGIAYDRVHDHLWLYTGAFLSSVATISQINPEDCETVGVLEVRPESPYRNANSLLAFDEHGDLWFSGNSISNEQRVYQVETGLPEPDASWLEVNPLAGRLAPGRGQNLEVTINTTGLEPGVYEAEVVLETDAGRDLRRIVLVRVEVTSVTFDAVRQRIDEFAAAGDVTRPGAKRLHAALDLAERHADDERHRAAIKALERFQGTANDPRFVPDEAAREVLIADADELIEQIRERTSDSGGGMAGAPTPV